MLVKVCQNCGATYIAKGSGAKARKHCFRCASAKETALAQKRRAEGYGLTEHLTAFEWVTIQDRTEGACAICGNKPWSLSVDHIIPMSKGGTNTAENIQGLCLACNSRKSDKL